jgi:hypothetical protein
MEQFSLLGEYLLLKLLKSLKDAIDRHDWTFCNRCTTRFYSKCEEHPGGNHGMVSRSCAWAGKIGKMECDWLLAALFFQFFSFCGTILRARISKL